MIKIMNIQDATNVVKNLTGVLDSVFKYLSFGVTLLCISVSSYFIYALKIENFYCIISIYSGAMCLAVVIQKMIMALKNRYLQYKIGSPKWLEKTWNKLSVEEKRMLKKMYRSGCETNTRINDRVMLILEQKGIVYRPTQRSDGFYVTYGLHPWAETMTKYAIGKERNGEKIE